MTGPEQHAATLRDTIERAYKRGKALYPKAPADAYNAERSESLSALDELVAQANGWRTIAEDADGNLFVKRAEAAEARADELQREQDAALDREAGTSDALDEARREADELRAALQQIADNEVPTTHGGRWTAARRFARAALAGVQADNKDSA